MRMRRIGVFREARLKERREVNAGHEHTSSTPMGPCGALPSIAAYAAGLERFTAGRDAGAGSGCIAGVAGHWGEGGKGKQPMRNRGELGHLVHRHLT